MQLPQDILQLITNGSVAVIVFVMWFLSLKQFNKQQERAYKQMLEQTERMFEMLEQDIKYKEALTGILNRLEIKIDLHMRTGNERI